VKKGRYAPAMLDIAFVIGPVACDDNTCNELQRIFEFRMPHDAKMAGKYKYVMDVSRFRVMNWSTLLNYALLPITRLTETDGLADLKG